MSTSSEPSLPALEVEMRCSSRTCPGRVSTESMLPCQNSSCAKVFHLQCFKGRFQAETLPKLRENQVVCTKACYNRLANPPRLNWTNDGKNGPDDPQSSERILLDWLMFPGNYNDKWRGKGNKGQKKKQVAMEIAQVINDAGVLVKRDDRQVRNKIQHLERQFRDAYDFANTETGAGLLKEDQVVFDDAVMQKCSNYYDLLDIFSDRASSKPRATNMDNSLASSESDSVSVFSDEEQNNNNKRNGSRSGTSSILSHSAKKKRISSSTRFGDDTSAATARLANIKSELLSLQIAKLEEDRASERQAKIVDSQMNLVRQCIEFVKDNPGWPREDIISVFPAFESIIDKVLTNMKK